MKLRKPLYFLMCLSSVAIAAYAVVAYAAFPLGSLVHPDMRTNFEQHRAIVYTHIFASCLALLIGPFQFSTQLRAIFPIWHRRLGKIYLCLGVLLGGVSGLVMANTAYGGIASNLGFGILALLWLYTGLSAYRSIRIGDINAHQRWMIRNFALSLAALSLRIYLPLILIFGLSFSFWYPIISWLCWVPNLIIAEWLFNRSLSD
ncbi:DUF2306 domain-containing protein [Undibacterium fentianense]|uniref:DUF2306 domain-containing protein n=1 Tax=Undibacterium fentianense TaxID=2828728 RepID=A0A941E1V4_9BURK|nr:DUF2306 domain-containing protein [Undibacterium fentianense]MBR7801744.1 DUF2306 domain-containing protein [Undibacterium fentianense]